MGFLLFLLLFFLLFLCYFPVIFYVIFFVISLLFSLLSYHISPSPSNKFSSRREYCIRAVETYLLEHANRISIVFLLFIAIASPTGDLSRKRFSAVDYFNTNFSLHSASMLNSILSRNHKGAIRYWIEIYATCRNARLRKEAVIEIIENKLSVELHVGNVVFIDYRTL